MLRNDVLFLVSYPTSWKHKLSRFLEGVTLLSVRCVAHKSLLGLERSAAPFGAFWRNRLYEHAPQEAEIPTADA